MPNMHSLGLPGILLLASLAGCQTVKDGDGAEAGACRPAAAEALAGKPRMTDEEAMRKTGAKLVRQIRPGDPVTMDFRQERVTIETDPATGKIVRAMCG